METKNAIYAGRLVECATAEDYHHRIEVVLIVGNSVAIANAGHRAGVW